MRTKKSDANYSFQLLFLLGLTANAVFLATRATQVMTAAKATMKGSSSFAMSALSSSSDAPVAALFIILTLIFITVALLSSMRFQNRSIWLGRRSYYDNNYYDNNYYSNGFISPIVVGGLASNSVFNNTHHHPGNTHYHPGVSRLDNQPGLFNNNSIHVGSHSRPGVSTLGNQPRSSEGPITHVGSHSGRR